MRGSTTHSGPRTAAADPLAAILAHWHALRGSRPAPARSELDPRRIGPALEFALIAERNPANADGISPPPRIRLAGQHPAALMGMELRGMPLHALIAPADRARFRTLIAPVFDDGAAIDLNLTSPPGHSPRLTGRMLLLPLTDDRGALTRALGGLRVTGLTGAPPRRLALAAGNGAVRSLAALARPGPRDAGMAEPPQARFTADPHPRAPHLRLVRTDG